MAKKDLFGRGEHNAYTFFDKRKKLIDWEADVKEGEALSTFILKGKKIAKDAPKTLKNMLGVMGLSKEHTKYSKEKTAHKFQVPLEMIMDEDGNYTADLNNVDNFFGACIQRASLMKNVRREDYAAMIGATDQVRRNKRIVKSSLTTGDDRIHNLIKSCIYQEMADKVIADKFPGYLKFVQKNKKSLFEERWKGSKPGASKRTRFLDVLVRMLRYPSSITEHELDEFQTYLSEVEKSVKTVGNGFPKTQDQADKMVRSLYKIVHMVEDDPEPPSGGGGGEGEDDSDSDGESSSSKSVGIAMPQNGDNSEDDDDQDEQDDDQEGPSMTMAPPKPEEEDEESEEEEESEDDKSEEESEDESDEGSGEDEDSENEEDEEEEESEGGSGEDEQDEEEEDEDDGDNPFSSKNEESEEEEDEEEDDEENGDSSDGGSEEEDEKEQLDQELMDALADLLDMQTKNESNIDNSDMEDFEKNMDDITNDPKIQYNYEGYVSEDNCEFIKSRNHQYQYTSDLATLPLQKAHVLRNLFTMKNESYKFSMKSMKSGRFDESKLVEARAGVPTVYERMGTVQTDQICIIILVDESGSMNGKGPGSVPGKYITKISSARKAAIYLNEVFGKIPGVDLFIYGHTEGNYTYSTIRVYREPGLQMDPFALGDLQARGSNRDGEAILACAKRVRRHTDKNGIYMVISDGQPAGSDYGGRAAIEHTRMSVKKAEKLGFQVVQIAIDSSVPSEQMFTNFVKFNDISTLPADLVRFMSRKVTMLMKERVSF